MAVVYQNKPFQFKRVLADYSTEELKKLIPFLENQIREIKRILSAREYQGEKE